MHLMNELIKPLIVHCVVVYFDDILIYNKSKEENLQQLERVFQILEDHQLSINFSKCSFVTLKIIYLGFIICAYGIQVDPTKSRV